MSKQYQSFADLKSLGKDMKARAKAEEQARAAAAAKHAQDNQDAIAFRRAMSELGVQKMRSDGKRVLLKHEPPAPAPKQREIEKQEVLQDSLSDECDPVVFLESDDGMLFRRQGVSPDIPRKLYRGEWTVQAHIDLHGLFVDEAREAVTKFLRDCRIRGYRCLRIVHGKGYGSVGGQSVLKEMVRRWLKQREEVMAFVQAPPHDGDSGAVIVLLTPQAAGPQRFSS